METKGEGRPATPGAEGGAGGSRPTPVDRQLPGCLLAFLGMLALTLTPALGRWVEIPRSAGNVIFLAAVVCLFGGAAIALLGGSASDAGEDAASHPDDPPRDVP